MNAPTTSLYLLADEYRAAAERMADLDLPDEVIADTLEGLAGAIELKATNVAMFVQNLQASAAAIKDAESKMALRRKAIEARAERVRSYLKDNMQKSGISTIECPYFKIAIRDNPPSVKIDAESEIPAQFMRAAPPPPPIPDKRAIGEALRSGETVPGCHLERGSRLEIK